MRISVDISVVLDIHTETRLPTSGSGWYGVFYSMPGSKTVRFGFIPYSERWQQFFNFDYRKKRETPEGSLDNIRVYGWTKCDDPAKIFSDYATAEFITSNKEAV